MHTKARTRHSLRRPIVLTALLALVLGLLPAGLAAADVEARGTGNVCSPPFASSFDDVAGSAHEDNVLCMADYGLTEGTGDGTSYSARTEVTRAQMASFIARLIEHYTGQTLTESSDRFDDVPAVFAHASNIHKLLEAGVTEGTAASGGESFAPQQPVTRGQMASFISRAATYIEDGQARPETQPPRTGEDFFPDDDGSAHEDNINALAQAGVVEGFPDGTYRPGDPVFRDQMAAFVMRSYDWAVEVELGDAPASDPDPAAPVVSITAPTADDPAEVAPGDQFDVTFESSDASSYAIEARDSDDGDWADLDGDATGTVDDGTTTATVGVPEEASEGTYDLRVLVSGPQGSDADVAEVALVVLETGAVTGTVVDEDTEEPIEGATVSLDNGETYSDDTDEDGIYLIEGIAPDTYDLTTQATGYETVTEAGLEVEAAATEEVDVELSPATAPSPGPAPEDGSISGVVTAEEGGAPVVEAVVTLLVEGDPVDTDATDGDGLYGFEDVAPGDYSVEVEANGFETGQKPVSVSSGEDVVQDVALVLADGWVLNTDTAQTFGEVQAAVDAAAPDQSLVARGRFEESVEIDVAGLSLASSEEGDATITFAPETEQGTPTVLVTTAAVTIEDLEVRRVAASVRADDQTAPFAQGVLLRASATTDWDTTAFTGLTVAGEDFQDPMNSGIMVRSDDGDLSSRVEVTGNDVDGFASGIAVTESDGGFDTDGEVGNVLVSENDVYGYVTGVIVGNPDIGADEPQAEVNDNEIAAGEVVPEQDEVVGLILSHAIEPVPAGNTFGGDSPWACVWQGSETYADQLHVDNTYPPAETAEEDAEDDVWCVVAQPGSVSGVVSADEGGASLEGAGVGLVDEGDVTVDTATTGADGAYGFEDVEPGEYTVEVEADGFEDGEEPVSVAPGADVEQDVALVLADGWVLNTDTGDTFEQVQDGVDAAAENDSLVARGEFDESVVIATPLSLESSEAGGATIAFEPDTSAGTPTVLVEIIGVTLTDLAIERTAADDRDPEADSFAQGVLLRAAGADGEATSVFDGLTVTGVGFGDETNSGIMVRSDGGDLTSGVEVTGNDVAGFASGIAVTESDGGLGTDGAVTGVEVSGNDADGYVSAVVIGNPDIPGDEPEAQVTDNDVLVLTAADVGLILSHEIEGNVTGNDFSREGDGDPADFACVWQGTEGYAEALETDNTYDAPTAVSEEETGVWCVITDPGSVSGVVSADEGGASLEGAGVSLVDEEDVTVDTATTGADGAYGFEDVEPGEYTVEVEADGFEDGEEPVSVAPGADVEQDVAMILEDGWVLNTDTGDTFGQVQAAVDAAAENDSLVARGAFDESVEIGTALSLSTSQAQPESQASISFAPEDPTSTPTVLVETVGVVLEDLKIERVAAGGRDSEVDAFTQGVLLRAAGDVEGAASTITGLMVVGDGFADVTNSGIMVRSDGGALDSEVEVSGNDVAGFASGIAVTESDGSGTTTDGDVSDVEVSGNDADGYVSAVVIGNPDIPGDEPEAQVTDNDVLVLTAADVGLILSHEIEGNVTGNDFSREGDGDPADFACVWQGTEGYAEALETDNTYDAPTAVSEEETGVWCVGAE